MRLTAPPVSALSLMDDAGGGGVQDTAVGHWATGLNHFFPNFFPKKFFPESLEKFRKSLGKKFGKKFGNRSELLRNMFLRPRYV